MQLRIVSVSRSVTCLFFAFVWAQPCFAQTPLEQVAAWKTIKLGTYRNVIDLREALEAVECAPASSATYPGHRIPGSIPCKLGDTANEIIGKPQFQLGRTLTKIDLVRLSAEDLGFRPATELSLGEIYKRAESVGYGLCPPEAGAQLRLQYTNQRIGEFLIIAMQPIRNYAGELTILSVGNGGSGLLLVGNSGDPAIRIPATAKFVFMRSSPPPIDAVAQQ